ncbi:MAG: glycosyltransferase family 4 protein [Patescibacteria group bacterium]
MSINYAQVLAKKERNIRAIYIGSYIPRQCGIATFTKDLTSSINVLNPLCLAEIVAVNPPENHYDYPWEVKFRFDQNDWKTYTDAAKYINQSSAEIVCLEHEFGLFGGHYGENIVKFLKLLNKPICVTFHTVLPHPDDSLKHVVQQIAEVAETIIVMINAAADRLEQDYQIDRHKVVVIPHGVPDITFAINPPAKGKFRLKHRTVMSTFGLINEGKGLEYAISAIPEIIKTVPNLIYLVLGETHPVVKRQEGEKYRRKLNKLVKDLGIKKHVRFENRYLTLDELISYLQATDIYVTPYLNPEQITSGTLAYAVGAGLPCVSTPYIYAQEVLDENRGVLAKYRDKNSIAKAVVKLATDKNYALKIRRNAYAYGRQMTWDNVALKHLDLFTSICDKNNCEQVK